MLTIEKLKKIASTCPYGGWLAVTEGTGELVWSWFKRKPYFNGDAWVRDEDEDVECCEVFDWLNEQGVKWHQLDDLLDLIDTSPESVCIKCGTAKKQKPFKPIIDKLKPEIKDGFLCDDGKNIYWSPGNFGFEIADQNLAFPENEFVFKLVKKPKGTKYCHTKEKTVMMCRGNGYRTVYLFSTFKMFETNLCEQKVSFDDLNKDFAKIEKGTVSFAKVYRDYGTWGSPKWVECNKEDYIRIVKDFDEYSKTWKAKYDEDQKQLKLVHL